MVYNGLVILTGGNYKIKFSPSFASVLTLVNWSLRNMETTDNVVDVCPEEEGSSHTWLEAFSGALVDAVYICRVELHFAEVETHTKAQIFLLWSFRPLKLSNILNVIESLSRSHFVFTQCKGTPQCHEMSNCDFSFSTLVRWRSIPGVKIKPLRKPDKTTAWWR